MEPKLIKTKFSNFSLKNIIIKLKNSRGFHGEIRKRRVSYLEEMIPSNFYDPTRARSKLLVKK